MSLLSWAARRFQGPPDDAGQPVGKQIVPSKHIGIRPGFDTHHARIGHILVKDASSVDLNEDAKHYSIGHGVHHISVTNTDWII